MPASKKYDPPHSQLSHCSQSRASPLLKTMNEDFQSKRLSNLHQSMEALRSKFLSAYPKYESKDDTKVNWLSSLADAKEAQ